MPNLFDLLFKTQDKASTDQLGAYPEKVHVMALPERRYLLASRFLVITATVNICICMMLGSIIFVLLPGKSVKPQLMQVDNRFNRIEFIEPHEVAIDASLLITEMLIAEYINLRHSIISDIDEMYRRWGANSPLFWYSQQGVFNHFEQNVKAVQLNLASSEKMTREVEIKWISKRAGNMWRAEFYTHDYSPQYKEPKITVWRVLMRVGFIEREYPNRDEMMKNPFNFMVINYALSCIGPPN